MPLLFRGNGIRGTRIVKKFSRSQGAMSGASPKFLWAGTEGITRAGEDACITPQSKLRPSQILKPALTFHKESRNSSSIAMQKARKELPLLDGSAGEEKIFEREDA